MKLLMNSSFLALSQCLFAMLDHQRVPPYRFTLSKAPQGNPGGAAGEGSVFSDLPIPLSILYRNTL
jgi:hypothetical protein